MKSVYGELGDPFNKLKNWGKIDPCVSNWAGVICAMDQNDGYLHVIELYAIFFIFMGNYSIFNF